MPAPKKQTRSSVTRDSILEAVDLLVRESGVSELRIRAVAARAGVSTGSIYDHFATREDLIAAWEQRTFGAITQRVLELVARHQVEKPGLHITIREMVALGFESLVDCFSQYGDPAQVASLVRDRISSAGGFGPRLAEILRGAEQFPRVREMDVEMAIAIVVAVVAQTATLMPAYSTDPEVQARWGQELGEMIARYMLKDP